MPFVACRYFHYGPYWAQGQPLPPRNYGDSLPEQVFASQITQPPGPQPHSPAAKPGAPQPKNQKPHKRDSKALALENTVEESDYLRHPAHGGRCPIPLFTNVGRGAFGFSGFGGSLSLTGVLGPGTSSGSSWKREMTTIHAWREHPYAFSSWS